MRQCPKCGTPIADGSTFCTTCGLKIETQPAEA
ncbi:MAG: zinc ribbon domain-containing protein, partial [Acutalibacteraceae bacterium]